MAWRTINNVSSRLERAGAISTGSFTLLYARRQITDLNADSGEMELQGSAPSRVAGIVSSGNGTDFYGHATVGETWVGAKTGNVASTINQWSWRLIIGSGTSLRYFSAPDNASSAWVEFPDSPLTQTVFSAGLLLLGGNGREAGVHDFAAIRLWNTAKTPSALVAERAAQAAVDTSGLILDKLGTGASLSASLAAGTGTLTASGTVTLNGDLPSSINTGSTPTTTPVTVGGRLQVDPLVTVDASSVGDVVSFAGEYSSVSDSPTISVALKDGGSTVDTASPTGEGSSYSGSFSGVADGAYTVEVNISDSETSAGMTAVSGQVTVDEQVVAPGAPVVTLGTVTSTSIEWSWADADSADIFEIEMSAPVGSGTWQQPEATTSVATSPNVQISVRVRAGKGGLWSEWSEWVAGTTLPGAPAAPSVTATTLSDSSIRVDWSSVTGATEYRAYRKVSPGGNRTLIYTGTALTFTDADLAEGSIYFYDVSASSVSGTTFSAETNATTLQSDGPRRLIVRVPERIEVGQAFEVVVQTVTGRGDAMAEQAVTITPSLLVSGDLSADTDAEGYALFILTAEEAGALSLAFAADDLAGSASVDVVEPGTEDSATYAARLAAAEKKNTRTTPKPSPAPLDGFAPPLELMPAESVSPLATLLNEMLLTPQMPVDPISLSEFMPVPQAAPPPSNGTQKAIEALDQVIAAQMQRLAQQLDTLNKLIE